MSQEDININLSTTFINYYYLLQKHYGVVSVFISAEQIVADIISLRILKFRLYDVLWVKNNFNDHKNGGNFYH